MDVYEQIFFFQLVLWVCIFNKFNPQKLFFFQLDVITLEKTGEQFRLIYDVKGRFCVHRITAEEAKVSYTKEIKPIILKYLFSINYVKLKHYVWVQRKYRI
jgi:hypothetical protein